MRYPAYGHLPHIPFVSEYGFWFLFVAYVDPRVLKLAERALPAFVPRLAIIANLFEARGRQLVENIGCSEYRLDSSQQARRMSRF
jgi:hypothetical protein